MTKELYNFEEFKEVWEQNYLLVFDTNFLLQLYDYTPATTEYFLKLIEENFYKIWLPNQVVQEFNDNHQRVRNSAYSKFKQVPKALTAVVLEAKQSFKKKIDVYKSYRFPYIDDLEREIDKSIKCIEQEIESYQNKVKSEIDNNKAMIDEDKVKGVIEELHHKNGIGKRFTTKELLTIYREGEERYKYKVPPGYMDSAKEKESYTGNKNSPVKKFGDLIIWKEILRHAKKKKTSVVFVTLETKEDWWSLDEKKQIIGVREELMYEFSEYSSNKLIVIDPATLEKHVSQIKNMINIPIRIELEALQIVEEIFKDSWDEILNGADELSQDIIESGALNSYFKNKEDYNIFYSYSEIPNLENVAAAIKGNTATITAKFQCETVVDLTLYVMSHDDEDIEEAEILLNVEGNVTVQFEFDSSKVDDYINEDSIKTDIDSLYISFINELA